MSQSIDNRVVQMQFDNKGFESGAKQSILTLEKLKKGLDLDKATASLSNLEKTFAGFSLGHIESAIDGIGDKFSALGVLGVTAMQKISSAAIDAGAKMVKALTVDNIGVGFNKYEQLTNAVQAIHSALPDTALDDVYGVMETLNKYTDETSYNFSDMANTIGKFVNAGVSLTSAEKAVEGIANAAADAGVGIHQASSAFYNLSQAMAKGKLKYDDYRSLELMNFATIKFRQTLMDTAVEMGTLTKKGNQYFTTGKKAVEVTTSNLGTTLQKDWATAAVLEKTLVKYQDRTTEFGEAAFLAAQKAKTFTDAIDALKDAVSTSWMNSFRYIFGDLEEASDLWTDFANRIIEFSDRGDSLRNDILEVFANSGARQDLIDSFYNLFTPFEVVNDLWNNTIERFLGLTVRADAYEKLGENIKAFTERIKDSTEKVKDFFEEIETQRAIRGIFDGLVGALDIFRQALGGVKKLIGGVFKGIKPLVTPVLRLFGNIGNLFRRLGVELGASGTFDKWSQNILNGFQPIFDIINPIVEKIEKFNDLIIETMANMSARKGADNPLFKDHTANNLTKIINGLVSLGNIASQVFGFLTNVFSQITAAIAPYASEFIGWVGDMAGTLGEWITKVDESGKITETLNEWSSKIGAAIETLKNWGAEAKEWIDSTGILDSIRTKFDEFSAWLIGFVFGTDSKVIGYNGLPVLDRYAEDANQVGKSLKRPTSDNAIIEFTDSVNNQTTLVGKAQGALEGLHKALSNLATWFSKNSLGDMLTGFFGTGISFIGGVFGKIGEFLNVDTSDTQGIGSKLAKRFEVFKTVGEDGKEAPTLLNTFIGMIQDMARTLDSFEVGDVSGGIVTLAKKVIDIASDIISYAISKVDILKMVKGGLTLYAFKEFASMIHNISELFGGVGEGIESLKKTLDKIQEGGIKGLLGRGGKIDFIGKFERISLAFVGIASAILELATAAEKLSKIPFDKIGLTFTAEAGLGGLLTLIMNFTKDMSGFTIGKDLAFVSIAAAINMMADALVKLKDLDLEGIGKGLAGTGGLTLILGLIEKFSKNMSSYKIGDDLSFVAIAGAINMLTNSLVKMSKLDLTEIGKGFLGTGGLGAILGVIEHFSKNMNSYRLGDNLSFIAIAKAIDMLSNSLVKMSRLNLTEIGKGMLGTGGLGAILGVIEHFSKNMNGYKIGDSLSFVSIAKAIEMLTSSLIKMSKLDLTGIAKGFLGTGGLGAILTVIETFTSNLQGFTIGKDLSFVAIAKAMEMMTDALVKVANVPFKDIGTGLIGIFGTEGAMYLLVQALGSIPTETVGVALANLALITGSTEGIFVILGQINDQLTAAGLDVEGKLDSAAHAVGKIGEVFGSFFGGIVGGFLGSKEAAQSEMSGEKSMEEIVQGFIELGDLTNGIDFNALDKLLELFQKLRELGGAALIEGGIGGDVYQYLTDPIYRLTEQLGGFQKVADDLATTFSAIDETSLATFTHMVNIIGDLAEVGKGLAEDPSKVTEISGAIKKFFDDLASGSFFGDDSLGESAGKLAAQFDAGFAKGIQNGSYQVQPAANSVGQMAHDTVERWIPSFRTLGWNVAEGFADGIRSGIYMVTSAASEMAAASHVSASAAVVSHSPSRLFMELGQYVAEGYAIGIQNGTGDVENAAYEMSANTIAAAQAIIDDEEMQPTIRPIIDMTDVQSNADLLSSLFGGYDSAMSLDLSKVRTPPIPSNTVENAGIIDAINNINNRIDALGNAITTMSISLNGDVLVGAMAPAFDTALGKQTIMRGRGA